MLSIGLSRQYLDHSVTAVGWKLYKCRENGRRLLFFKVLDGYSSAPRYLIYKGIFGIFATKLVKDPKLPK